MNHQMLTGQHRLSRLARKRRLLPSRPEAGAVGLAALCLEPGSDRWRELEIESAGSVAEVESDRRITR